MLVFFPIVIGVAQVPTTALLLQHAAFHGFALDAGRLIGPRRPLPRGRRSKRRQCGSEPAADGSPALTRAWIETLSSLLPHVVSTAAVPSQR